MKYHNITKDDMRNGDGLRVVLWVSGCEHHCEGCQNPITWNPDDGLEFTTETIDEIYQELDKDYISGLTISGGDPLYSGNVASVIRLCKVVKMLYPEKTIWIYTGYKWEFIPHYIEHFKDLLQNVDVLVDGRFEKDKLDVNYPWAGSTNQRVIDVQESLKLGKVVLYASNQERWYVGGLQRTENCCCG